MLAVKLREEIATAENESQLVRNINPVISWENYQPPQGPDKPAEVGGVEGDPEWFFAHTYPTSVIKDVLEGIKEKINGKGPGVFPLDGYLGSGKSHILLTLYHIFRHPEKAKEWFEKWNIDFPEIENTIVIPIPLQDISYKDLWTPIFKALGVDIEVDDGDWPKAKEIKKAIGNKRVLILIDEIDNWYDAKDDREKARIRGFLQSLSEASEDPEYQLYLVITFLGFSSDVKVLRDIVARPRGGSSIVMQRTEDIFDIVRFRLFEDVDDEKIEDIILDYLKKVGKELEKKGLDANSHLKDELKRAYPFHPAFLRTLSSLKVRQMLVMLARIVLRKLDKVDIIIASDLDDDLLREYLHSMNSKIVDAYFEDIRFVQSAKEVLEGVIPFDLARAILITSMLNTTETKKGADIKDIIFGCGTKYSIQDIEDTISFLEKWTRLKKIEEDGIVRYVITTELPVAVKIERKAELVSNEEALEVIQKLVEKTVSSEIKGYKLIFNPSEIRNDKRLKVLTLLEKPIDISSIYPSDFTYKNTLYLLYPGYSLKSDETIKLAKRIVASKMLSETEEPKKPYKDFHREYMKNLKRQIDNAGWRGFRWFRKDLQSKPLPDERTISKLEDVDGIIKNYASTDVLKYFLKMILDKQNEISVRDLKERFYRLEGAPIILREDDLLRLISEMTKNGEIALTTKQGRTIYKNSVPPQSIGNEDIIKKPPETAIPPTTGEVVSLVKDRKKLPFKELTGEYPFIDEGTMEKVYLSAVNPKDGIYVIEENKVVPKPVNTKTSVLMIKEKAAEILEPIVLKIVRERIAINVSEIADILKDTYGHTGITDDLLLMAADNLEISGKINILRKKEGTVIQLPEDFLIEEIKKKIFFEVKREGEIRKDVLIEDLMEKIPTEVRFFEDAIASLVDDGKLEYDKDTGKLSLPKKKGEPGKPKPERRKILIKQEGKPSDILKEIEKELDENDVMESVRIEFEGDLTAREIKEIIGQLGDKRIKFVGRRREI